MNKDEFPKQIFVTSDDSGEGDDGLLVAWNELPIQHGDKVAIYELKKVGTIKVKNSISFRKAKRK